MAKYASKVVAQAKSWLGKNEKDESFKVIIDTYNTQKPLPRGYAVKYTDEWCATFVSAIAVKLGYTDIMPTECSCPKMIDLFKKIGAWVENENRTPKAGDIIFYDWEDNGKGDCTGAANHVGIVEKVSKGVITVIEGNKNCAVDRRTIAVNGKLIRGYAVPKYDAEPKKTTTTKKSITDIAKEVLAGKWGNGEDRVKKLVSAGYNYDEVQAEVNRLSKKTATTKKTAEEIAKEVLNGKWGNGAERKEKLTAAGYDYDEIQDKVNELSKQYSVKVTASSLNIRKGAGTNYAVVGRISDKGTYPIVDVSTGKGSNKGWGKLKSGAGWISLDYCKKV